MCAARLGLGLGLEEVVVVLDENRKRGWDGRSAPKELVQLELLDW